MMRFRFEIILSLMELIATMAMFFKLGEVFEGGADGIFNACLILIR
jgi:hypothetical protein